MHFYVIGHEIAFCTNQSWKKCFFKRCS